MFNQAAVLMRKFLTEGYTSVFFNFSEGVFDWGFLLIINIQQNTHDIIMIIGV